MGGGGGGGGGACINLTGKKLVSGKGYVSLGENGQTGPESV